MKSRPSARRTLIAQIDNLVRQYVSLKITGSAMMASAASKSPIRRDSSMALLSPRRCDIAGSDILFAPFGNQPGRLDRQHQQQKRKDDDVDQAGIEKLRRIAFNETDDQPCKDRSLDIAETADDDDGKSLHDHRGPGKRREHEHGRQQ